ncbi:glutathione S-transferase family protein [Enhygromyxa salina]|nr:glutathione S-transferase C-terminal domain-containing protein [Enhygromyxa salina]
MGLPLSESPPCAKVEVYLVLTGTPFEEVVGDTRKSPTKLVPYVRWPNGELQAESGEIIARLEETIGLDAGIDPERLARGRELAALAEEIVYDAILHDRFITPEGARLQRPLTEALVRHFVPGFLAPLAAIYVDYTQRRRAMRTRMVDPELGYAAAFDVIAQIVGLLGDDPFLCGEEPCTVDCSIWPLVVHAGATPNRTPLRDVLRTYPTLVEWVVRFGERLGRPIEPRQFHA